jgi:RNA polymerase sigma factor (TIGR02999 family)
MSDVTRILNAIEQGDAKATDELLPLVYEELRLLAAQKLSHEPPGQTLQATALVHEAYLRLVEADCRGWNSRNHFFMAAAEAMQRILVENARRKKSLKSGGGYGKMADLEMGNLPGNPEIGPDDLLALNEALEHLAAEDHTLTDLIKLHCFAGLSLPQVADMLGVSSRTAERYWAFARAWLHRKIRGEQ